MATITAAAGSTNWTTAAFGAQAATTAADDVVIPTGASVTISSTNTVLCRSLSITGTGTIIFAATTSIVNIGTTTPGTGNVALSIASGATVTLTGIGTINLISTSATQQTITSGGKTLPNITVNGAGSNYILGDALISTGAFTVTSGAFDSNSYNITVSSMLSNNANVRSIALGTSVVTVTILNSTAVDFNTVTNLTFSGASATFVVGTATISSRLFRGGGLTFGTLQYTVANSPGQLTIGNSNTFGTLDIGSSRLLVVNNTTTQTVTNFAPVGVSNAYVYMPGSAYGASAPDSAALSTANDLDIRLRVALDDVSKAGAQRIMAKYGAAGQRSWRWYISGGGPVFEVSNDGTNAAYSANCTTSLSGAGLSSGTTYWFRVARDRTGGTVKFYYAADSTSVPSGGSWTQLGSTISGLSTATLFDSTTALTVGGDVTGTNSNPGKYYRAQLCTNLLDDGSAIAFDADFTTKAFGADSFTESSSNAATVTMNGGAVQGDGRLQIQSSTAGSVATINKPSGGAISGDYLVMKDIKVVQPLAFFAGANSVNVSNNTNVYFTAPGMYRHVQSIAATAVATSVSATFPVATTAGSLLVCHVVTSGTSGGSVTAPSGFTQAVTVGTAPQDYIYYKIADGSETTLSYSQTTSRTLVIELIEYTGFTGTPTLDATDSNSTGSSVTSLSTTATTGPTNAAQPALALALWGSIATMAAATAITNGFNIDYTPGNASTVAHAAAKELTSLAAVETTLTWTTARAGDAAALAVFKDTPTAPSSNGNFFQFFN